HLRTPLPLALVYPYFLISFKSHLHPLAPHSFPTRRSSDLPHLLSRRTIFAGLDTKRERTIMITVDNLSFRTILHNISLQIPNHGITGLVGPNASGKTTLLRCMYGAHKPTSGRVPVEDTPLPKLRTRDLARTISVVGQAHGEPPPMTVAELVRLGRLPHGDNKEQLILDALARVGMLDKATRTVAQLSGGERQRAMIARAFVQNTKHMLLDEPTNHLDIYYQLEVFQQLVERESNAVVVLHDLNSALA